MSWTQCFYIYSSLSFVLNFVVVGFLVNIWHSLNKCLRILWEIAIIIKLNLPAIFLTLCEVTNFRMEVGLLIYMWITRPVFSESFPIRPSLNYFECSWDDGTLFQHHSQWIRSYLLFLIVLIFFNFHIKYFKYSLPLPPVPHMFLPSYASHFKVFLALLKKYQEKSTQKFKNKKGCVCKLWSLFCVCQLFSIMGPALGYGWYTQWKINFFYPSSCRLQIIF